MQKLSVFLWFDRNAEEAVNFYTSIFKNSKITGTTKYETENPSNIPVGTVMTVNFTIENMEFTALNGGPAFKFNESVSLVVKCKDQDEIDYYWEKLSADPNQGQCGWLKDKFGLSWQIIPENIGELVSNEKAMKTLLSMKKIIIKDLREAG